MAPLRLAVTAQDAISAQSLSAQLSLLGEDLTQNPDEADFVFWLDGPMPECGRDRILGREGLLNGTTEGFAGVVPETRSLRALQHLLAHLYRRHRAETRPSQRTTLDEIVGDSVATRRLREQLSRIVDSDSTVLLTGASGTGKSFIAQLLHRQSPRTDAAFVPVNCGAIPAELMESELFGHEKGAFTGAVQRKLGRFELAEQGTLFLDEVGELPAPMQVKLLRALQERAFERVGGIETLTANARIIAATNAILPERIAERSFREDLYYRLSVIPVYVPSLAERRDDLPFLIGALSAKLEARLGRCVRVTDAAVERLSAYAWPGNLRELGNLLERLTVEYGETLIGAEELPSWISAPEVKAVAEAPEHLELDLPRGQLPLNGIDLKGYLADLEQRLIEQALRDADSVVARAADRLQIRRTTLVEKMRKYGIDRPNS
ncbi:MAG: sigma-54 dependent transcriptional regulator [Pseudomonadota bacterium]